MSITTTKGQLKKNYNLNHLTWFKVGGPAEILFKPFDTQDLASFLRQNELALPVTTIGAGSNLIIRDGGIDGIVVKLGQNFTEIQLDGDKLLVGAGCLNFNLAKFCEINEISGFEFLVGIPGTIGGGVAMNAGAYGKEFKDIIIAAEAVDGRGNLHSLALDEIGFRYRGNLLPKDFIITKVIFRVSPGNRANIAALMNEISAKRALTQPIKEKTGGSTFANPPSSSAWKLIQISGLRGCRLGDASISTLHCNFMINHGNASAADLEELGEFVRQRVFADSGIMLEWEIKRIGKHK